MSDYCLFAFLAVITGFDPMHSAQWRKRRNKDRNTRFCTCPSSLCCTTNTLQQHAADVSCRPACLSPVLVQHTAGAAGNHRCSRPWVRRFPACILPKCDVTTGPVAGVCRRTLQVPCCGGRAMCMTCQWQMGCSLLPCAMSLTTTWAGTTWGWHAGHRDTLQMERSTCSQPWNLHRQLL